MQSKNNDEYQARSLWNVSEVLFFALVSQKHHECCVCCVKEDSYLASAGVSLRQNMMEPLNIMLSDLAVAELSLDVPTLFPPMSSTF